MSVPEDIRTRVRTTLWTRAEELGWTDLPQAVKSRCYENWTKDPAIGGVLVRYLEPAQIRVYLKDSLLKGYARQRASDPRMALIPLGVDSVGILRGYSRPHGVTLDDGRTVCWGRADNWKVIITSLFERTYGNESVRPFGVVLTGSSRGFGDEASRAIPEAAARCLGAERIVWLP